MDSAMIENINYAKDELVNIIEQISAMCNTFIIQKINTLINCSKSPSLIYDYKYYNILCNLYENINDVYNSFTPITSLLDGNVKYNIPKLKYSKSKFISLKQLINCLKNTDNKYISKKISNNIELILNVCESISNDVVFEKSLINLINNFDNRKNINLNNTNISFTFDSIVIMFKVLQGAIGEILLKKNTDDKTLVDYFISAHETINIKSINFKKEILKFWRRGRNRILKENNIKLKGNKNELILPIIKMDNYINLIKKNTNFINIFSTLQTLMVHPSISFDPITNISDEIYENIGLKKHILPNTNFHYFQNTVKLKEFTLRCFDYLQNLFNICYEHLNKNIECKSNYYINSLILNNKTFNPLTIFDNDRDIIIIYEPRMTRNTVLCV
jgi:hypothetical protein